jgi:hypothetical protein
LAAQDKLSPRQEAVIAALLSAGTAEEAARAAGVSPRSLRRWQQLPAFQDAYRKARAAALSEAVRGLEKLVGKATQALARHLDGGNAVAEVRAAVAVIDRAFKGYSLIEMEERLQRIEARTAEIEASRPPGAYRAA